MTREEIIQGLYRGDSRAIKEAIKELEQEPCEDAVSRRAVHDMLENLPITDENKWFNWLQKACMRLAELPPVTPTKRWIPVSEKLPENKTYVLTTIKVPNRIAHTRSGWYESGFFHNDNGDVWRATDMEVIAWMPLPEPYKPESED